MISFTNPAMRDEMPYHLDGDVLFARRFEIQILPYAIDVIISSFGRHFFS